MPQSEAAAVKLSDEADQISRVRLLAAAKRGERYLVVSAQFSQSGWEPSSRALTKSRKPVLIFLTVREYMVILIQ